MSIATIIAMFSAYALFFGSVLISTDNYTVFLSLSSFIMVFGGTMSAMFISYEPRYVLIALKMIPKIVFAPTAGRDLMKAEVGRVIKWAYAVQKDGTPVLEKEAKKAGKGDRFLKFGMDMVVSGYNGDEVREILTNMIESTFGRNTVPVNILKDMGAGAPAFGMVGTLIGLVIMLNSMGGDPSALGAGLAVAMITTLYGVFFARVVFIPAASKVMQRAQILKYRNYLVMEGLVLLADRKSPRYIQDKMNSYLDPAIHFNIDKMKK